MVIATPSFILSGFTWPLSQMPEWIQYIASIIPLTHFLSIFRVLIIENGPTDLIYPYVQNLLIITAVGFVLSYVALAYKKRKLQKETVVVKKKK
jgi:ABC-2 type transport system permease protein